MSHGHALHGGITCAAHQIYYTLGKIVHKLMPLSNDEHCFSKPVILGNLEFQSFRQSWTMCGAVTVQKFASPVLHIAHWAVMRICAVCRSYLTVCLLTSVASSVQWSDHLLDAGTRDTRVQEIVCRVQSRAANDLIGEVVQ